MARIRGQGAAATGNKLKGLEKSATGIRGLDEITGGGLPKGRPTLVCGGAGCGKTMLAMEYLVRGAVEFDEPGVFIAFEESEEELVKNVASTGFDLKALIAGSKLALDHVHIERSEIEETGEFDLEGLFIRLSYAIDSIGAKRVVLDTIEALFAGLPNEMILRAELRRLFRWLKQKGVTAIITGERGEHGITRHGLEEYVADCVILLDHQVQDQISTRRLRIVKYRGSSHETNEYPFLISDRGISVLPITSLGLDHAAPTERVSSGVARLDAMLGGGGYYRGSTILVSGFAGTGKTSLAAAFVAAAAKRKERSLYFSFEESPAQLTRNMRSIGIDYAPIIRKGLLRFQAHRPSLLGLESHLLAIHDAVRREKPQVVIIDPLTDLIQAGTDLAVKSMVTRLIDFLKRENITALFTSLCPDSDTEASEIGVSSLIDTWILLRNVDSGGERNRALFILKSRGMANSNQVREFILDDGGIHLLDVYSGPGAVLTGSARAAQEALEKTEAALREQAITRYRREMECERQVLDSQIQALRAGFEARLERINQELAEVTLRQAAEATSRQRLQSLRDRPPTHKNAPGSGNGKRL